MNSQRKHGAGDAAPGSVLAQGAVLALFAVTLFSSAFLLFWVQPMIAKMILPLFGGSASVWNTCLVFFQTTLLAGYLYADVTDRRLKPGTQRAIHLALLVAVLLFLPLALKPGWHPPATSNPAPALLLLLVAIVGLPAFVLSATAPMVQKWFSQTGHAAAADPYFLYSASNLGSMLALVGYPTVIELHLALPTQSRVWMGGFVFLMLGLLGCAAVLWRSRPTVSSPAAIEPEARVAPPAPTLRQKGFWLLLSFVPSSLLLGVTTHITTDVAAVPFLWVIPLALYLATFVIAFSRRPILPHRFMLAAQPFFLLVLAIAFFQRGLFPLATFPIHILSFFATAMVCHGELAIRRPPPAYLTKFYLWLSLGGVLGGIFNALLAPLVFKGVAEYLLVAVAAVFLRPNFGLWKPPRPWLDYLLPAAVLLALPAGYAMIQRSGISFHTLVYVNIGVVLLATVAVFTLRARPLGFGLGLGAIIVAGILVSPGEQTLHQERNFFGVLRVSRSGNTHTFIHGKTLHGAQSLDPAERRVPLLYHSPSGPLGEVFAGFALALEGKRIAVAGLGVGAIAAYGRTGEEMVFYELDPAVERIARDPRYFSFLADSAAAVRVVIGDARLKLAEAPDGSFAMIVADAFSSDAVPVHLLTREAVRLYLRKLAPDGVLVFNISNAYLDLQPVLHALAEDAGLVSAIRWGTGGGQGAIPSTWVVMARNIKDLTPLAPYTEWYRTTAKAGVGLWTDDYSNIFRVLKFR